MPAMLEYVRDEPLPDRGEILARLGSHDRDVLLRILTLLCPCRNACYDADVWSKLPAIRESQWDFEIREAASHAIGTLRERARVDVRSRELLWEMAGRLGDGMYSPWVMRKLRKRRGLASARDTKLARRDVPTLIELLSSDDASVVDGALAILCPADRSFPSKRVWRAILDAQRSPDPIVRRKAVAASAALDAHTLSCDRRHE